MSALNEFLPPLLGGFLFSLLFTPLRLYLARADGYRLLFAVSTAAFYLPVDTSKLGVMNFETVILASEIQSLSPFEPEIYDEHFGLST